MNAKKQILLVDDDASLLRVTEKQLSNAGYDVIAVPSAEDALEATEAGPVDLVVTDVEMPGMNGQDLLKIIKSNDALADIPVLMLTGRDDKQQRLLAAANGADAYALKSSDPQVLFQIAREATRRWLRPQGTLGACGTAPRWTTMDGGSSER